jgi:hypothetical protein
MEIETEVVFIVSSEGFKLSDTSRCSENEDIELFLVSSEVKEEQVLIIFLCVSKIMIHIYMKSVFQLREIF